MTAAAHRVVHFVQYRRLYPVSRKCFTRHWNWVLHRTRSTYSLKPNFSKWWLLLGEMQLAGCWVPPAANQGAEPAVCDTSPDSEFMSFGSNPRDLHSTATTATLKFKLSCSGSVWNKIVSRESSRPVQWKRNPMQGLNLLRKQKKKYHLNSEAAVLQKYWKLGRCSEEYRRVPAPSLQTSWGNAFGLHQKWDTGLHGLTLYKLHP